MVGMLLEAGAEAEAQAPWKDRVRDATGVVSSRLRSGTAADLALALGAAAVAAAIVGHEAGLSSSSSSSNFFS